MSDGRNPETGPGESWRENFLVADLAASCLKRHGVSEVFGQSLPSMLHLANSDIGIRQIAYRTESSGAIMADGYARVSGRIGVVTAQNGAAAALLVPGLLEALTSSVPILGLIQEVPRDQQHKHAFQEADHRSLLSGCVKWFEKVDRADRVEDYIDRAITIASSGRPGPVVLSLPPDLLLESCKQSESRTAHLGEYPLDRVVPEREKLSETARLLAEAEHPLIVVGGGVHISGAAQEVARLQETFSLPVVTTMSGKGSVNEMHPLSLGVTGGITGEDSRCYYLRDFIDRADLVFLIGTRMAFTATEGWTVYRNAKTLIHLDVDPVEVGLNYEARRLVGDVKATISALLDNTDRPDLTKRKKKRVEVEKAIAAGLEKHRQAVSRVVTSAAKPARPERLVADADRILGADALTCSDASYSTQWTMNFATAKEVGQRFPSPRGLAGLGWGLPLAMGAKVARPEAPVVTFVGDGGFAHSWAELETCVRMNLPIVTVVLNNGILGFQVHAELVKFDRYTDACEFAPVDHAAMARACGCDGIVVDDPADFGDALQTALASGRPTVIDAICDPKAYPPVPLLDKVKPMLDRTPVPQKQR